MVEAEGRSYPGDLAQPIRCLCDLLAIGIVQAEARQMWGKDEET